MRSQIPARQRFKIPAVILDGSSHLRFLGLPYFIPNVIGSSWFLFGQNGTIKTSKRFDPGVILDRPLLVGDIDRIAGVADVWFFEVDTWRWVKTPMSLLELLGRPTKPGFDAAATVAAWKLKDADGRRVIGSAPKKYRGLRGPQARRAWLRDLYEYTASAVSASLTSAVQASLVRSDGHGGML
jgi:hypothetical protein